MSSSSRQKVTVIDTGVGNLGNLVRALEHLGAEVRVSEDPWEVRAARCLVLPGVGAFRPPRETLTKKRLESALRGALDRGAWLLGVCVGFQLLFEASEEFGVTDGLGLLPGRIERLPSDVPLPHIGWNRLHGLASHPLLEGLHPDDLGGDPYVYFVHSFAPADVPRTLTLASCTHGREFPAVAGYGRVLGTQFHPEKSGQVGLRLLANYLEMAHGTAAGD